MDIKNSLTFRTDRYNKYRKTGFNQYNYEENGILNLCLPKLLFKGNATLVSFLQLIDLRFIMLLKAIDKIKHFKHISWYD